MRRFHYLLPLCLLPAMALAQHGEKPWVAKSNAITADLLAIDNKYTPEFASSQGLAQYDTLVMVPTKANELAARKEKEVLLTGLKARLAAETDPFIKQDIEILIREMELNFRTEDFEAAHEVPNWNATEIVYEGLQSLLDDQTPEARRASAVVRLRKYVGLEPGYRPITEILKERITAQMGIEQAIYPARQQIQTNLERNGNIVSGIEDMFRKYNIVGYGEAYTLMKRQLKDYDTWTKKNILPKSRKDFRLPPEAYQLALEGFGVDIPPAELARMAHATYDDLQAQMKPIAAKLAEQYHLPSADYREVIKYLKKQQFVGDSILPAYRRRLGDIENIIREHGLVTLPDRPAIIRLASAAETVQVPAPHMQPPPFLHNTGEKGVFVLPLNVPAGKGKRADPYDDFTFDAAAWTMIAHEARPGHELQFDKMVEEGVSQARSLYAFNSTNVEGWGLYSEYITFPYMPLEGQLISLDFRMMRAARAFLDPELQAGTVTQDQAMDLLLKDVVLSHAMAAQEVERYTIKSPGQANSYFYGYTKMLALRKDAEAALGAKFSGLRFHDFILSQGILPPALIREAVMEQFVPAEQAK